MKQYLIDELRPSDYEKIKAYMDETFGSAPIQGIYWIPIDPEILADVQCAHPQCQPFYFAVDLEADRMACELLVRTHNRVRCSCMQYASERQRNWLVAKVDAILEELGIIT